MIIFLLLRRMSPHARHITGWILMGLGVLVAAATPIVHYDLYVHGAILAACGIVFLKVNPKPRTRGGNATRKIDNDGTHEVSRVA